MGMGYGLVLVTVVGLGASLGAQRGLSGAGLLAAADVNADGKVTKEEWATFRKVLKADEAGTVSSDLVKAHLLKGSFDRDGDGKIDSKDLQALYDVWDGDGDGRISKAEWGGNARGRRGGYATEIVCVAADPHEKNELAPEDWQKFLKGVAADVETGIAMAEVATWIAAAQKRAPVNRNAINASVYLTTLDGALDRDRNGKISLSDLDALFGSMDANGDGILTSEEANQRRTRTQRGAQAGNRRTGFGQGQRRGRITDADKRKPCLIPWQRSLEDALALVKKTGKPLLICVNMDGESASESLAWGRYRDPAFARLMSGFIPILASPDKHSSRDHDDEGRRITDPRFGRLVDAEHILIEPKLFDRYFQGRRVAPRHVAVSPKGEILFDLFLLGNLSLIDEKLAEFGMQGALPDPAQLSEGQLLASTDAACRDRLEELYRKGDEATRTRLVRLSLSSPTKVQHPEILRLALRDEHPMLRRAAIETLALFPKQGQRGLFAEAFFACAGDHALQVSLVEALRSYANGNDDAHAKAEGPILAAKRAALLNKSRLVDLDAWTLALARATPILDPPLSVNEVSELSESLDRIDKAFEKSPDSPALFLRSAELNWRLARVRMAQTKNPMFLLEDQKAAALRAMTGRTEATRAQALLALAHHYLDEGDQALFWSRRALPALHAQVADPIVTQVLDVYLQRARAKLYKILAKPETLPGHGYLVADLTAAHELRLRMGGADEKHYLRYTEMLNLLAARRDEWELIKKGLASYPRSGQLHAKMRLLTLETQGAAELVEYYASFQGIGEDAAWADWFAGLGLHFAAERYLADRRPTLATETWKASFARFESSFRVLPGFRASTSAFLGFAWTGLAQVAISEQAWPRAAESLKKAFEANPNGLNQTNGLGQSPASLASALLRNLDAGGFETEAKNLRTVLTANGWRAQGRRR